MLRFHTVEQVAAYHPSRPRTRCLPRRTPAAQGERRPLILNLRKGYLKQGEWFGSKIYLSQVQSAALGECMAGEEEAYLYQQQQQQQQQQQAEGTRTSSAAASGGAASAPAQTPASRQQRLAPRVAHRAARWLRCRCLEAADVGDGERLYTLSVVYQQHRWARLFGLSTISHVRRAAVHRRAPPGARGAPPVRTHAPPLTPAACNAPTPLLTPVLTPAAQVCNLAFQTNEERALAESALYSV